MPVYTYHCDHCDHEFEQYQSFSEDALTLCPECRHEALRKVYSPALVVFKGKGFYVTDTKSAQSALTSSNAKDGDNGTKKKDKAEPAKKKSDTKTDK